MTGVVDAITGGGSRKAAAAQVQAAGLSMEQMRDALAKSLEFQAQALDTSKQQFGTALKLGEPYRDAGQRALANYESLLYGVPVEQTSSYLSAAKARTSPEAEAAGSVGKILSASKGMWSSSDPQYQDRMLYLNSETGEVGFTGDIEIGKTLTEGERGLSGGERSSLINQRATEAFDRINQEVPGDVSIFEGDDVTQPFDFRTTPGYQFRLEEGQKALERGASARSGLQTGRQGKALQRYGQDVATLEFDKILDRLSGVINTGASAATTGANQAIQSGGQQANILGGSADLSFQTGQGLAGAESQVGAARASGYLGTQAAGGKILDLATTAAGAYATGGASLVAGAGQSGKTYF